MFRIRWNASDFTVNRGLARERGKEAGRLRLPTTSALFLHPFPTLASPTQTPRLAHAFHFARTRGRHPALKRVAGVSILRRWRGGRAANCTGLENRRVFTHVGSNPTPSAREQRSRRRGCYSNPGLSLRGFASSAHLRRRCAAPRLRIPPPVAFLPFRRATCYSNPGLRLRRLCLLTSPSDPLRGPRLRIPPPVAFLLFRRANCYSNPGLRLWCFASSPRLWRRCRGLGS